MKTVLMVDGISSGKELAKSLISKGHRLFHITSGSEADYNLSDKIRESYVRGMTEGVGYYKTFVYSPDTFNETLEELRGCSIDAVIPGTESGVFMAEKIARELGCNGNDPETSGLRRDKYQMQNALKKAGLRSIEMILTDSCDEALEFFRKQRNGKMIVKPVSSAGSESVCLCKSEDEVRRYFEDFLGGKDFYGNENDKLLVQEFIEGTELVANDISHNGRHVLTDAYRYIRTNTEGDRGFFQENAEILLTDVDYFPFDYINKALDAVGIEYGFSHMEFKIDDRGPVMIEVGARPMGESCHPAHIEALGFDINDAILESYLSEEDFDRWSRKLSSYHVDKQYYITSFISTVEGEIEDIPAYGNLSELKTVRIIDLEKLERRRALYKSRDMVSSPGFVYLVGDTKEEVQQDYDTIRDWEKNHPEKLYTMKK